MKNLHELDAYRDRSNRVIERYGSCGDHRCGVFRVPHTRTGAFLLCIASSSDGWDHVSVSLPNRTPNWYEMEHVRKTFFKDDEVAMQLHVPAKDHVNIATTCLHLWRPHEQPIPMPPVEFV